MGTQLTTIHSISFALLALTHGASSKHPLASTNTQNWAKAACPDSMDYKLLHQYLEPIYNRLSSVDLLRRCEIKTTQNPNESFHYIVWSR
ncbi:hypothetical protein PoB_007713500 [Plakobranchus ocellatus]|uniref:Uncharacterized protein n=1 Tax=Plakobranchus ocellatus TaxID=259542 RepID=A0AAV4E355_9GAST|nr:hypothetical protein PoB_007713500 [Plakobranchus ocellatus]